MMARLNKLWEYRRLGLRNIWDVGFYRLLLKLGLHKAQRLANPLISKGPFFHPIAISKPYDLPQNWRDHHWAFGYAVTDRDIGYPPQWHSNILTGQSLEEALVDWDKVPIFTEEIGDIKTIWEASRFDWLLAFVQQALNGNVQIFSDIEHWLADWNAHNPPYKGPNWVCAQEASIRLCHMMLALHMMGQLDKPTPAFTNFIINHLRRIAPTTAYARGQDNNHATSEAMALVIGGWWLKKIKYNIDEAQQYCDQGRTLLEERVKNLIFNDGGFAQYSVVYHRLMLDSLSVIELFRRLFDQEKFSNNFYDKARKASIWLETLIVGQNGDVPNWGANDGAMLLPIGRCNYRDFRPSVSLAATLFRAETPFQDIESSLSLLQWLNIDVERQNIASTEGIYYFEDSGLLVKKWAGNALFLRLPAFKFRPSQCDILHIDLWVNGENILIDSGSYSYAQDQQDYFASTAAHNVCRINKKEQMPRLSRFLFGRWPKKTIPTVSDTYIESHAQYDGYHHHRTIEWCSDQYLKIVDRFDKPMEYAEIFWHISALKDDKNNNVTDIIEISSDNDLDILQSEAQHSLYYLQKQDHIIYQARGDYISGFTTKIRW